MLYIFLCILCIFPCHTLDQDERWNGFLNYVEHRTMSINISYNIHATFRNEAEYPVNLYKVKSMSKVREVSPLVEAFINIGESVKISCEIGDTFTARAYAPGTKHDNLVLLAHDVATVYINDNGLTDKYELVDCKRKPFTADRRWTPPDSFIFSNRYHSKVSIYYFDGVCEEKVGEIIENNDHHIQSTIGHAFRIRDESGKLIQHHVLQEVPIFGLTSDEDYEMSEKASILFNKIHLEKLIQSKEAHEELIAELQKYVPNDFYCNS